MELKTKAPNCTKFIKIMGKQTKKAQNKQRLNKAFRFEALVSMRRSLPGVLWRETKKMRTRTKDYFNEHTETARIWHTGFILNGEWVNYAENNKPYLATTTLERDMKRKQLSKKQLATKSS